MCAADTVFVACNDAALRLDIKQRTVQIATDAAVANQRIVRVVFGCVSVLSFWPLIVCFVSLCLLSRSCCACLLVCLLFVCCAFVFLLPLTLFVCLFTCCCFCSGYLLHYIYVSVGRMRVCLTMAPGTRCWRSATTRQRY